MENLVTVDPGANTGVAVWEGKRLLYTKTLRATKDPDWQTAIARILFEFEDVLVYTKNAKVAIELPGFFAGAGGRMVAARGDLVKLATLAGGLAGIATVEKKFKCWVDINLWKGQVEKGLMLRRIQHLMHLRLPAEVCGIKRNSHELDAIGIGMHLHGWLRDGVVV